MQYSYLRNLRDQNRTLFYAVIKANLKKCLPVIYTPTVADTIREYSHIFSQPEGIFLSLPDFQEGGQQYMQDALSAFGTRQKKDIDLIIVTDAEGILGIGDWGAGGINICIGKQTIYTVGGGVDPARCLNIVLDVGTNNKKLLDDELYVGWRHERVRGQEYEELLDCFCHTAADLFPDALIHFEDFGTANALRLLEKFRPLYSVFNDDIQGTGATALASLLSAVQVLGTPLKDHTIVLQGPGVAGLGIARQIRNAMMLLDGLSKEEANARFYLVGRFGLIVEGQKHAREGLDEFARPRSEFQSWKVASSKDKVPNITLAETVKNSKASVLIGTSTVTGSFNEEVIRTLSSHVEHPIILPLSNPTTLSECKPDDAFAWSKGKALIATGSPFAPVMDPETGRERVIAQLNNALIFPGLGLGTMLSKASRLTDNMIVAGVQALSKLSPAIQNKDAGLLPDLGNMHIVSKKVALAVMEQAVTDGVAQTTWPS